MDKMKTAIINHPQITEWLEECRRSATQKSYVYGITKFFTWYANYLEKKNQPKDQPIETYLALNNKDRRHLALVYQNTCQGSDNTICSILTALSSFLSFLDQPINWQRKRKKVQPDTTSHEFSTDDFTRMFNTADTKGKALLALGCSLGWEISAVLELERTFMQNLIAKAKSEKAEYYYFKTIRQKTGAPRLGVLNPLAILWVGRYLEETKDKAPRKRRSAGFNPVGSLFDIHPVTVNNYLRALAGEARIVVTGRLHWHKIRGWVMSTLSRSGLNEFQIKYIVGKSIPLSDSTYLQSLRLEIEEREKAVFDALEVLGLDRAGQVIAQKEKQQIAEVLHKDPKTVRGYLNRLVDQGSFSVEGSKNNKVFTLLADVKDIKEKLSCSSFKSCSNDDLVVRMVKEAQSNGYFFGETDVLWGGGLEKENFVPAVYTEKISNDQQTINYALNSKNGSVDRLMSVQTMVRPYWRLGSGFFCV
jgi:hypothetical protein